jgi:hypothetical protein
VRRFLLTLRFLPLFFLALKEESELCRAAAPELVEGVWVTRAFWAGVRVGSERIRTGPVRFRPSTYQLDNRFCCPKREREKKKGDRLQNLIHATLVLY